MSRLGPGVKAVCGLVLLLGGFLLVTGILRLVDDSPGTAGPILRLVVGVLLLAGAVLAAAVAARRVPRSVVRGDDTQDRAGRHAETVTCPACGAVNPPSMRHCHVCDQALR